MKNLDFLTKIKHEKKLELVELSEQLSKSYTEKSRNCLLSQNCYLMQTFMKIQLVKHIILCIMQFNHYFLYAV